MNITFKALEYTSNENFEPAIYSINLTDSYWIVNRNDQEYLKLNSSGYILLRTKLCGICSTDLNRKFLPFPLPQVIGHEILAESLDGKDNFVVEISDSCVSHKDKNPEIFCSSGLRSHCPNRMVLGINLLLGGFSPYILVPINSVFVYNRELIDDLSAVFVEPLAAALNAIYTSPPRDGDSVAIIGPKKLGALIIAALNFYRTKNNINFKITAVIRREEMIEFCFKIGSDFVVSQSSIIDLFKQYDIVYDTSGTEDGFKSALYISRREVHLKSTNGQTMCGLKNLTALVVDEISICQFNEVNLKEILRKYPLNNSTIFLSENIEIKEFDLLNYLNKSQLYSMNINQVKQDIFTDEKLFAGKLPRFDFCIVKSIEEIDFIIRPFREIESSLIKPTGTIFYYNQYNSDNNDVSNFLNSGGSIKTSRCGDFNLAINLLQEDSIDKILSKRIQSMITNIIPAENLDEAFQLAKSKNEIKVLIQHKY